MASGMTLAIFDALASRPPSTASPQIDLRNGHPVLDFDDTANESTFFIGVLPSTYSAGGLQLKLTYCASTAATGTVSWGFAFERKQTGVQDIDGDGFGAESSADGAVASQAGVVSQVVATIPATSLSGAVAGEPFRLQVRRRATEPEDTVVGDVELLALEVQEA